MLIKMQFKLPSDIIFDIYCFGRNGAIISWAQWKQMCASPQINARATLVDHLKHLTAPQDVPDQCCTLLAWLSGMNMRHADNNMICGLVCTTLETVLPQLEPLALVETINLTLSVLAKADASRTMQIAVRRKISAHAYNRFASIHKDKLEHGQEFINSIQYYTPYDSPELAVWQMKRFPITKYVSFNINGAFQLTNIPDLANCAFPINVTNEQIEAYLHLTSFDSDRSNDRSSIGHLIYSDHAIDRLSGHSQALYGGKSFLQYSNYYRKFSNRTAIFTHVHAMAAQIDIDRTFYLNNSKHCTINNNFPYMYLVLSLLCGKRCQEFLECDSDTFDKIFNVSKLIFQHLRKLLIPAAHNTILRNKCILETADNPISYKEATSCPLFVSYVKLFWQHRELIMAADYDSLNFVINTLPHLNDPAFVRDIIDQSMATNKDLTQKLVTYLLNNLF